MESSQGLALERPEDGRDEGAVVVAMEALVCWRRQDFGMNTKNSSRYRRDELRVPELGR